MFRREALQALCAGGTLAVGLSIPGCIGIGTPGPAPRNGEGTLIEMTDDNRYGPDSVTISVGEPVVWRNVGYAPHTVTAYEDEIPTDAAYFASGGFTNEVAAQDGASTGDGVLDGGEEYSHNFDVAGAYAYYCIPHEDAGMTGTVTVEQTAETGQGE